MFQKYKNLPKSITKKYFPLYQREGVKISLNDLKKFAGKALEDSKNNYQLLKKPRTCDFKTYACFWIKEEIIKDFTARTLKKVNINNSYLQDDYIKSLSEYFSILPLNEIYKLHKKLFGIISFQKRKKLHRKYKPMLNKLEKSFEKIVLARNKLANKKGYSNFIEFNKQNNGIPEEKYQLFIAKIDRIIAYYNRQLPKVKKLPKWFYSRYNLPCLFCQMSFLSLPVPNKIIKLIEKLYPQVKPFSRKIKIIYGEVGRVRYIKEKDAFQIIIRKDVNSYHQTIDLIHELGHVIDYLDNFTKEKDPFLKGKYLAETKAFEVLFTVLQNVSQEAFKAYLMEVLLTIQKALFEIEVYTRLNQDCAKTNARLFNRCFPNSRQRKNPFYLIDEQIINKPLSSLAYAIAATEVLLPC